MTRGKLTTPLILIVLLVLAACSRTFNVSTAETKAHKREVLAVDHVESVKVYFLRPDVYIEVRVSEEIGRQDIDRVLELTRNYVTTDNMNKVARQVKWSMELSSVHLELRSGKERLLKRYVTHYFKTYDTTDRSPENLDEYRTWSDVTPDP